MSMEYQIQLGAVYGCKVDYAAKTMVVSLNNRTDMHVIAKLVNSPAESREMSQPLSREVMYAYRY